MGTQNTNSHNGNDEITLKEAISKIQEWVNYLRTKWIRIFIACILGALFGFTYSYLKKPVYTASLSFALEDEKSTGGGLSGALGLASSLGIDLGTNAGGAFTGANLIELMKSRFLVEKALLSGITYKGKTATLVSYYLEFTGKKKQYNQISTLVNTDFLINEERAKFSLQKDSILGEIYKNIVGENGLLSVIQRDKKISIIDVEVKSENEIFSKVLTENIVKEVSDYYIETKSRKARNNVAILQKQFDSVRNELDGAITNVANAADNTFNLNSAMNVKRIVSTKKQVDVQANSAILTQLITNLELAKVTLLKETPLIQIIDKPILPLKKEKPSMLKSLFFSVIISGFLMSIYLLINNSINKNKN